MIAHYSITLFILLNFLYILDDERECCGWLHWTPGSASLPTDTSPEAMPTQRSPQKSQSPHKSSKVAPAYPKKLSLKSAQKAASMEADGGEYVYKNTSKIDNAKRMGASQVGDSPSTRSGGSKRLAGLGQFPTPNYADHDPEPSTNDASSPTKRLRVVSGAKDTISVAGTTQVILANTGTRSPKAEPLPKKSQKLIIKMPKQNLQGGAAAATSVLGTSVHTVATSEPAAATAINTNSSASADTQLALLDPKAYTFLDDTDSSLTPLESGAMDCTDSSLTPLESGPATENESSRPGSRTGRSRQSKVLHTTVPTSLSNPFRRAYPSAEKEAELQRDFAAIRLPGYSIINIANQRSR